MLSGGKLFDEGMYGCIFTPPLECNKKKTTDNEGDDTVLSKIILSSSAKQEWAISRNIVRIPLWKNYFIVSESPPCIPSNIQKEKELKECDILTNPEYELSDFRILNMPYGGIPLSAYHINLAEFDFMKFIIHLIEAGALLNLFGIVHRDIHQGNILVDNDGVLRIIDFNLSLFVQDNITVTNLKHKYEYNLAQEPPDSTLVNAIFLGYNYERIIDSVVNKKNIMKKIRNILGITSQKQEVSLDTFYRESKSMKVGDEVMWFKNYWRTIDSWAIGVNIIDLISKLSIWPEFTYTLNKVKPTLFPVLKRMCEVNPKKRIDCVQALKHLAPQSFIIRKYGKMWLEKVGNGNI